MSGLEGITPTVATMPNSYSKKQDIYLTTVYDSSGKVTEVTTAHTVDYLV